MKVSVKGKEHPPRHLSGFVIFDKAFCNKFVIKCIPNTCLRMLTQKTTTLTLCLFYQERLPKANGSPADSQGHLQLLCGHNVIHHQNRLLCAVWQREHRDLRAGNGQAGDKLRVWSICLLVPFCPLFCFGFFPPFLQEEKRVSVRDLVNLKKRRLFLKAGNLFLHYVCIFPILFLFSCLLFTFGRLDVWVHCSILQSFNTKQCCTKQI